jgi:hypothetical protein
MLKMIRVDFLVPGDMVPDTIVQANLFLIHNTSYTCTMMTDWGINTHSIISLDIITDIKIKLSSLQTILNISDWVWVYGV